VVLAVGVGLAGFGLARKFEENLNTAEMSRSVRRAARWLGAFGYAAKGVAYPIVGLLLGWAAISFDPNKARGLDSALRTLAGQPYGRGPARDRGAGLRRVRCVLPGAGAVPQDLTASTGRPGYR
jgi:hypothetical protein